MRACEVFLAVPYNLQPIHKVGDWVKFRSITEMIWRGKIFQIIEDRCVYKIQEAYLETNGKGSRGPIHYIEWGM